MFFFLFFFTARRVETAFLFKSCFFPLLLLFVYHTMRFYSTCCVSPLPVRSRKPEELCSRVFVGDTFHTGHIPEVVTGQQQVNQSHSVQQWFRSCHTISVVGHRTAVWVRRGSETTQGFLNRWGHVEKNNGYTHTHTHLTFCKLPLRLCNDEQASFFKLNKFGWKKAVHIAIHYIYH